MFTWICPQCGREVPPSYDECPGCGPKKKAGEAPADAAAPPDPSAPPPAAGTPPPVPRPQPPRAAAPPPRPSGHGGLPTWLLTIVFTLAFFGLAVGVYWTVGYLRYRSQSTQANLALENAAAKGKTKPNPLQRYIEVAGVRFIQNAKKQTQARFLVVNHAPDQISDLAGTVIIWGRTQKSDEESVGTFEFKVPTIGPWESKEANAPVNTKLRVYELPDWQNVTAEVTITAP